MKRKLMITGMTCSACKAIIEDICGDYSEITSAVADVKGESLTLVFDESISLEALKKEIESEGDFKLTL